MLQSVILACERETTRQSLDKMQKRAYHLLKLKSRFLNSSNMDVQRQARRDSEMNAATIGLLTNAQLLSTLNRLLALESDETNVRVMSEALRSMGMLRDGNQTDWDKKSWEEKMTALHEMKGIIQNKVNAADPAAVTVLATSTAIAIDQTAQVPLSPERQVTLDLLLGDRYTEGLAAGLYTEESAPKFKVEAWLRQDLARLDAAAKWEARGGHPMFVGEFADEWVLAECSKEVPEGIRNICYGPNAAKQQGLSGDRNALTQAVALGGALMPKALGERLEKASLINNARTWEWRAHPDNRDLEMDDDRVKDCGLAWAAGYGHVSRDVAAYLYANGGLRCSLSGPKS
jgi:hypothetical protein